jgi:hypothetical protein
MVMQIPLGIDALADLYRDTPAPQLLKTLTTGVCGLTSWSFVVLGDHPHVAVPYIGFDGDDPFATVFTDTDHAAAAVNSLVDRDPNAAVGIIQSSVQEGVSCLEKLEAQGLSMVRFNHGPHRFDMRIVDLIVCFERLWFSTAQETTPQPPPQDVRWRAIDGLPQWYFVGDHGRPAEPVVWIVDGEPCVMLFTDRSVARAYADDLGIPLSHGRSQVVELSRANANSFLLNLRSQGVAGAMFNEGEEGLYRRIDRIISPAA